MATLKIVFRPSARSGSPGSLSLRVVHGRKSKMVSTFLRLFSEEWSEAGQSICYPCHDSLRVEYLRGIGERVALCVEKMNGVIRKLESRGLYTAGDVIHHYRRATDESKLTGFAAALSEELIEKGQYRTAKAYGTVCRGLVRFNREVDIPLTGITATLIKTFETHLKENGKQPNTISYYMRNLRAIYNKAVGAGRIPTDEKPFAGVYTGVEETRKRALTAEEVNRIQHVDICRLLEGQASDTWRKKHLADLERARQLFLFCLYAHGMSFVDMCYIKKMQLKDGVLRYYRKKTGKQIEVPLNKGMIDIIKRMGPEVKDSEYLFPILTGDEASHRLQYETALRTQNDRLKILSRLAGLGKGVTTHVARHSWASILKSKMQPLSVISEGLGHSSEKMTRKYLMSFDHSVLAKAGRTVVAAVSRLSGSSAAHF